MSEPKINWITLEHASEISGASVAILQDALRKYKDKPEVLGSKTDNGVEYVDRNQILALFSASSNPGSKDKIPGTLFRWFDELRKTYESSIKRMQQSLDKKQYEHHQDLKHQYETRIFELEENYQHQITNLKQAHLEQVKLLKRTIIKLEKQLEFQQQQNISQQASLTQLNNRYDAIILAMHHHPETANQATKALTHPPIPDTNKSEPADKTASPANEPAITETAPTQDTNRPTQAATEEMIEVYQVQGDTQWQIQALLESAYQARAQADYKMAFELFEQAALQGSNKAMGALARCYFTHQGVEQDIDKAIAWLRLAEAYHFEPAKEKLIKIQQDYPTEFARADKLMHSLNEQIHRHVEDMSGYTEA